MRPFHGRADADVAIFNVGQTSGERSDPCRSSQADRAGRSSAAYVVERASVRFRGDVRVATLTLLTFTCCVLEIVLQRRCYRQNVLGQCRTTLTKFATVFATTPVSGSIPTRLFCWQGYQE